jgi:hypothetical protein
MIQGRIGAGDSDIFCSPDSANGSRECAPDDRLRAIRDRDFNEGRSRIALRFIRATLLRADDAIE